MFFEQRCLSGATRSGSFVLFEIPFFLRSSISPSPTRMSFVALFLSDPSLERVSISLLQFTGALFLPGLCDRRATLSLVRSPPNLLSKLFLAIGSFERNVPHR